MPFDAPKQLGPFMVDREGRLSPSVPGIPLTFLFRWRERPVRAHIHAEPENAKLFITAVLGRVPSTASERASILRRSGFALLRTMSDTLPDGWRMGLLPDHRVICQVESPIILPMTATTLLTEITTFLMTLSAYLDLLEDVGLQPTLAGVGD